MDDETPEPLAMSGVEGALEALERFRVLSEYSTDAITEIGMDRRLVYVSPSFTRTFGYEADEVLGQDAIVHVHPDDLPGIMDTHANARVGEAVPPLRFRYRHKNGSWRWIELIGCPYRNSSGALRAILINRDITDQVAAEDDLKARLDAERRVEELSRSFLTSGWEDLDANIQRGLELAAEMTGADRVQLHALDRESVSGGRFFHWTADGVEALPPDITPESRSRFAWSSRKVRSGEKVVVPVVSELPEEAAPERRHLLAHGVRSYLALPIVHGDASIGILDIYCGRNERHWTDQDVTRIGLVADILASALRRQLEESIRSHTERRFQTLAESASDSICEVSIHGRILYASPRFTEISGYEPGDLVEMMFDSLFHPDDRAANQPASLAESIAENGSATRESRLRHRDGTWRWIESTLRPCETAMTERRYVVVIRDASERRREKQRLEQQLLLEHRLATLSRELLDRGADEIDAGIKHALRATGELAGSDRAWLVSATDGGARAPQNFEWCADGVAPREHPLGAAARESNEWVARKLADGEIVNIHRVAELPVEAAPLRRAFADSGIRSFLAIPIRSGRSLIGVLGFHALREEREWRDNDLNLFQIIAGMFTSALRRKRAETDLRESEERFRALAENAKDPICEVDQEGAFLYASPSFSELLGYQRDEIADLNLFQMIHPSDFETLTRKYGDGRFDSEPHGTLLYRLRHKQGDWVVIEGTAAVFDGASGERRVVAVIRDVTERQRVQETLERQLDLETRIAVLSRRFLSVGTDEIENTIRESLSDLAGLAEADRSWLVSFDWKSGQLGDAFEWRNDDVVSEQSTIYRNQPNRYAWSMDQVRQGHVVHIPEPSDLPAHAQAERAALEDRGVRSFLGIPLHSENAPVGFLGFETTHRRKTWTAESITLLRVVGEIFVTALRRKNIEGNLRDSRQQLMQAQKMEAVGTLAGGIAHDFNNQLTVMLGNARYVLRHVEDDPDLKDALTDLNRAAEHCAQLTRSLLAFSRRSAASPRALDPGRIVDQVQELLRPLIPTSIDFEVTPASGVDWVEADPTQLQQVLVNLAINARDAMPDGGSLRVTTRNRRIDRDTATRLGLDAPGRFVELGVADSGHGIDPDTLERIFEPFFTTKPLGQGTGLGLATAYGIVTEAGGAIEVATEVDRGTSFHVLLPATAAPGVEPEGPEALPEVRSSGTILLIEHESATRRFAGSSLERAGFDVLPFDEVRAALERLSSDRVRPVAIIADQDMPRLPAAGFARELAVIAPDVPILFLTSSSQQAHEPTGSTPERCNRLLKPFGEEEIVERVRELLQRS